MLKTQNFSIAINDTVDKMEIIGGNILIKDILPKNIYFKNLRSIKKLNIMFADQILTLDGKNLLTLKEILGKRFKKFFSPNRSLIEKSWKIIEDCILDNNEVIRRQISIEVTNKIGTSFAHNLKGTILTKMNLDSEPINNGFIFGKKKFHNDIILFYGKNYNLGSNDIVLEHYLTINNPDDLFMGLKKCLGCFLDETSTLGPLERIHKQSNCLIKLRIEDVYFLENYLHSHAMIIHETDSYIIPDIIQSHIESNIWHEHNFIIKPMLFKQDDIRLKIFDSNMQKSTQNCIEKYVKKEKFNKNLTIEKLNVINYKLIQQFGQQIFIYIDGSVINNGTENIDENFFNLRRNRKYTIDSVEWAITFKFLKENENVLQTNFHTTKRRRYKIKNLIEEIPTVEQRKLINFDIYKDWKCPVCERKKETFGHVWHCYSNRKRMRNIIYYSIICLIEKIKEYDIYTFDEAK
ncbi:unnamed protein product [Rhizophagus irregularis]|nr:unnamed protein product [Rhizophagus irregularis]